MITNELIGRINKFGFRVYMRKHPDTHMLFTDAGGNQIGYLQTDRLGGINMSTVHKPNRFTGTGFSLFRNVEAEYISRGDLNSCFLLYPHWASSGDRDSVKKYRDIEEYRGTCKFNEEYQLVTL